MPGETYIGDGVYLTSRNNTEVQLRAERPFREENEKNDYIILEPGMLQQIVDYTRKMGWEIK